MSASMNTLNPRTSSSSRFWALLNRLGDLFFALAHIHWIYNSECMLCPFHKVVMQVFNCNNGTSGRNKCGGSFELGLPRTTGSDKTPAQSKGLNQTLPLLFSQEFIGLSSDDNLLVGANYVEVHPATIGVKAALATDKSILF